MDLRNTTIFFAFIAATLNLFAQNEEEILLDDVVISETRIELPFSDISRNIAVLTKTEIDALNASSINEVLQQIAGVDVRQRGVNGVQADVSIRGGTFEQTLILINGVKIIDPQTGHHLMNLPINVEDIERIEVLKGPAARIYGQNAFAGAINIITKADKEHEAYFNVELGEHNFQNYFVNANISMKNGSHGLSFSNTKSDGYRYNTDFNNLTLNYQNQTKVLDGTFDIFAGFTDKDFGANGFYGSENFTEQFESIQTGFASFSLTQRFKNWKISPKIAYRRNEDNWQFNRKDPALFQNFHTTDVISAELQTSASHKYGIFGFGLDYQYINIVSNNLGNHLRNQFGMHIENRFILLESQSLDITPGVFILNDSFFGTFYYPGIDVGFNPSKKLKVFANIGLTNRLPTYTDLYYEDAGNIGNENLEPEVAVTREIGVKHLDNKFQLVASLFNRKTNNLIDWYKSNTQDKWQIDNFTVATYNGLDFSFKCIKPTKLVNSIIVNYQFLDVDFESDDIALSRNQLENLRHQIIVSPSFGISDKFNINLLYKYNARESLENFATLDFNVEHVSKFVDVYLRANNIFNKIYRESNLVEMPGRWVRVGANVKLY